MAMFKREHKILARKLKSEFNAAFISFQESPSLNTKNKLEKTRLEYDLFLTESIDKSFNRSKHNFYTKYNKPGTYLARALKSVNKSFKPICLKLSKNNYTSNPVKIVHKFHSHLAFLYEATNDFNPTEAFFSHITLPELSHAQKSLPK